METCNYLFMLFADLLEYPRASLKRHVDECAEILALEYPPAGKVFLGFHGWIHQVPFFSVEETYTSTFDLQGICCPYIGHYLFGDNYQRSEFMAQLNHGYHDRGYSCGSELPDHVAVILDFLAFCEVDEFSQALLEEGLIPSVDKMTQAFEANGGHPYHYVLRTLQQVLQVGLVEGLEARLQPDGRVG